MMLGDMLRTFIVGLYFGGWLYGFITFLPDFAGWEAGGRDRYSLLVATWGTFLWPLPVIWHAWTEFRKARASRPRDTKIHEWQAEEDQD